MANVQTPATQQAEVQSDQDVITTVGEATANQRRRLIVCCDGTWKDADSEAAPTNVVRIRNCFQQMDVRNPSEQYFQMSHYQRGIGTGTSWWSNRRDGATGKGKVLLCRPLFLFRVTYLILEVYPVTFANHTASSATTSCPAIR